MRSTGPRRKRRPPCSRRCRKNRSPSPAKSLPLEEPFFVLATQNPIEMEGTYPLPEAQLDRFMLNVVIDYLPEDDEVKVVQQTTGSGGEEVETLFSGEDLIKCHQVVRRVPVAEEVVRYAVRIAAASRPGRDGSPDFINEWVNWGAGTRAGQFLVLGGKTRAPSRWPCPCDLRRHSRLGRARFCVTVFSSTTAPKPKASRSVMSSKNCSKKSVKRPQ